jgi:hypothetical protein
MMYSRFLWRDRRRTHLGAFVVPVVDHGDHLAAEDFAVVFAWHHGLA